MLHIIFTGSRFGGAQKFALNLAIKTQCDTVSICHGDIIDYFKEHDLQITSGIKSIITSRSYDKIVLSDIRALVIGVIVFKIFLRPRAELFFVPHSDSTLRYTNILKVILSICKIKCLPTTLLQANVINKSNVWYRITDTAVAKTVCGDREKRLVYFGRDSKEKRISWLIETYENSGLREVGYTLHIFGITNTYRVVEGVTYYPWQNKEKLDQFIMNSSHVINSTHSEGISLQVIEGIQLGCYPLVYSRKLAFNLDLQPSSHVYKDQHSLYEIVVNSHPFNPTAVNTRLRSAKDIFSTFS